MEGRARVTGLLDLEEAQARLLALAPLMPAVSLPVEEALGHWLAQPLHAHRTHPSADLSAMDGYAIGGAGPWRLVGEARAGTPFAGSLAPGECIRISTGAALPPGADRLLIQEDAARADSEVALLPGEALPQAGQHVRRRGFDFGAGDAVLAAGTRIGPAQAALALAAGHARVAVRRAPVVAVLDSGDELARDPESCGPDQIPASNGAMLSAMLRQLSCITQRIGPVPDNRAALAAALAETESADVLISSGGASVGDHDLIRSALIDWGAELAFWKVAIRPGKPLMVATRARPSGPQVILGLPGNPVSSFVTGFLFALPLVRASMGDPDPLPRHAVQIAGHDLPAVGTRREFLRAVSDGTQVELAASQDSSSLRALAAATCLIDRPAGAGAVRAGEPVAVYNLQNG
jgi:molybdopterin molybdotransferase